MKEAPVFGQRLASFRKARGLTQPQLAEALEVSLEMLVYYERRAKNPSTEFARKTAAFFNVSFDELLGHSPAPKRSSGPIGKVRRVFEEVSKLPRSQQQHIVRVVEDLLAAQRVNSNKAA